MTLDNFDNWAGHRAFTKPSLHFYDSLVLGAVCHWAWRCPTERILDQYRQHLSANHLEWVSALAISWIRRAFQ